MIVRRNSAVLMAIMFCFISFSLQADQLTEEQIAGEYGYGDLNPIAMHSHKQHNRFDVTETKPLESIYIMTLFHVEISIKCLNKFSPS